MALATPDKHGITLMLNELESRIEYAAESPNNIAPEVAAELATYVKLIAAVVAKMPNLSHSALAASQMHMTKSPVSGRGAIAAHVLGAESAATPTWKLVALAAVAGVAGYMTPGLLKKLKKK